MKSWKGARKPSLIYNFFGVIVELLCYTPRIVRVYDVAGLCSLRKSNFTPCTFHRKLEAPDRLTRVRNTGCARIHYWSRTFVYAILLTSRSLFIVIWRGKGGTRCRTQEFLKLLSFPFSLKYHRAKLLFFGRKLH